MRTLTAPAVQGDGEIDRAGWKFIGPPDSDTSSSPDAVLRDPQIRESLRVYGQRQTFVQLSCLRSMFFTLESKSRQLQRLPSGHRRKRGEENKGQILMGQEFPGFSRTYG